MKAFVADSKPELTNEAEIVSQVSSMVKGTDYETIELIKLYCQDQKMAGIVDLSHLSLQLCFAKDYRQQNIVSTKQH